MFGKIIFFVLLVLIGLSITTFILDGEKFFIFITGLLVMAEILVYKIFD